MSGPPFRNDGYRYSNSTLLSLKPWSNSASLTLIGCRRLSLTFIDCHRLSSTFNDCHRLSSNFIDFHRLSWTIIEFHRLSSTSIDSRWKSMTVDKSVIDCYRLSLTFIDCHRLSATVIDFHRLSSTFTDCYWLSSTMIHRLTTALFLGGRDYPNGTYAIGRPNHSLSYFYTKISISTVNLHQYLQITSGWFSSNCPRRWRWWWVCFCFCVCQAQ